MCNVVLTGAPGVPDLRSAADPGADRWFSMVTSTIDATVTLLKERILLFLTVLATAPGGVKDEKGLWLACRERRRQHGWTCPRPHGNAVFRSFGQSDVGSLPFIETQKSHWNEKNGVTVSDPGL